MSAIIFVLSMICLCLLYVYIDAFVSVYRAHGVLCGRQLLGQLLCRHAVYTGDYIHYAYIYLLILCTNSMLCVYAVCIDKRCVWPRLGHSG